MQFVELPDIEDTVLGRELIQRGVGKGQVEGRVEGRVEGQVEAFQKAALRIMAKKWGSLPALEAEVRRLSLEEVSNLPSDLFDMSTPEELERWLFRAKGKKSGK